MGSVSAASWFVAALLVDRRTGIEILFGMLGPLVATTSTSGSSQPSGYTAMVDGSQSQPIGTNGRVTFTSLSAGSHSAALTNVASNCTVNGSNPRTVTVPPGGTITASFSASCTTPNRPPIVNAGLDQAVLLGVSYAL